MSEVAVSAAPVSSGGKLKEPPVVAVNDDNGCVESGVPVNENDAEPDSPLKLTAPDDEELAEDRMSTAVGHQVTGSIPIAVAVPITADPSVGCPGCHVPRSGVVVGAAAEGSLTISPCSGRTDDANGYCG